MKTGIIVYMDGKTERVELEDIDGNEPAFHNAVGGYIEAVPNSYGLTVFANEDGLNMQLERNVNASHLCERSIVGDVFVIGPPDAEGDTIGLTDAQIAQIENL